MAPTMKWDPEADAKLFGLVLNAFDLKFSGDVLRKMNIAMGLDPKSQSISHRLGAARKKAAGIFDGDAVKVVPANTVPLTPRGRKLGSGGGARSTGKRSTGRGKRFKEESDNEDSADNTIHFETPTAKRESTRTAGRKRSYRDPETDEEEINDSDDNVSAVKSKKLKMEGQANKDKGMGDGEVEPQASFFDCNGELTEPEVVADAEEPEEV